VNECGVEESLRKRYTQPAAQMLRLRILASQDCSAQHDKNKALQIDFGKGTTSVVPMDYQQAPALAAEVHG
jgi:hypothetical protein